MNRREFLKSSASLSAAAFSPRALHALASETAHMRQLDYSQVQLLDSPLRQQFDQNHAFFLALDNDRLLKPFRQLTGMPAPGEDMGGWYSPSPDFDPPKNFTGYVPGHTFGQYLSSLARAYAITGDKPTQQKVHELVTGFAATVSPKFYANYCLPCYTFDKSACGLIDAHQFARDPIALEVLNHATDAVLPYLPDHALTRAEMRARPHPNIAYTWDEPYTLPENLYLAYTRGAGVRFHSLAQRFLQDTTYFAPLSRNENVLPGEHAYSHVNALSSAMQAYLVDGSTMHFDAARNGFRFVQQSFATGGWGPNETFQKPEGNGLADSLTQTHASFETPCGAYGHFKITRYLLCATGEPSYGDSMESVLYNTILGARPIQPDGTSFYYSDYNNDAHKFFHNDKWPCCSGTFPQITADYGISSYFFTPRGLAVNLYHPSLVSWKQNGANISLTQVTDYPNNSGEITLKISTDRNRSFPIALRIPAWSGPATRALVNGHTAPGLAPHPGTWLIMDREWRNGDRIELTLDMPLRLIPLDAQHPDLVALASGPLALFTTLPAPDRFTRAELLAASRTSARAAEWAITSSNGSANALPFALIDQQRYRLYQQLS